MSRPKVGDPRRSGERWCDHCTDWRGVITTGAELDRCPTCADWRWCDERDKDEDDGRTYADPRDEKADRL